MNDYDDVSTLDTSTDGGGWGAYEAPPGLLSDPAQPDPAQPDPAQSAGGGLLPMPADLSGSIPGDGDGFGGLFSPSAFSAGAATAAPVGAPWWENSAGGGWPSMASRLGDLSPKADLGPPVFPYPTGGDNGAAGLQPAQQPPPLSTAQPASPPDDPAGAPPAPFPDYPANGKIDQPITEAPLASIVGRSSGPGDGDGDQAQTSSQASAGGSARPASAMSLSPAGAAFIKSYEQGPKGGVATRQYPSPEGGSDTIGWGHKIQPGENFSGGITAAAGDRLFDADSIKHQRIVQSQVKVPLTPNQYDALTDLAYNLPAAFSSEKHSTLLRLLNQGNYAGAAAEFARWNHIGKAVSSGLTKRRAGETNIFLNGTYVNHR